MMSDFGKSSLSHKRKEKKKTTVPLIGNSIKLKIQFNALNNTSFTPI